LTRKKQKFYKCEHPPTWRTKTTKSHKEYEMELFEVVEVKPESNAEERALCTSWERKPEAQ
jgi:hypothetical protein